MPEAAIAEMFARLEKANPNPRSDLEYVNAFTLLVAVVLSAQATDAGVNKATRPLFAKADTAAKMAALGEDELREAIKTIGLFRNKAKNVIALSHQFVEKHGGEVPDDREALEALPGVGRKSANVVLNIAFGHPVIAVDTHILRLANRTRPRARQPRRKPSRPRCNAWCRNNICCMRIIGLFCTAATFAARKSRNANAASSPICAAMRRNPRSEGGHTPCNSPLSRATAPTPTPFNGA